MAKKVTLVQAMKSGTYEGYSVGEVKGFISAAIQQDDKARNMLHFAAVAAVYHIFKSGKDGKPIGDYTLIESLLNGLGKRSQRRHRIAAFIRHHGMVDGKYAIFANITSKGEVVVKVNMKLIDGVPPLDVWFNNPYWEIIDTQRTQTAFELAKGMLSLVKRDIKANEESEEPIPAKELENAFVKEARKQFKVALAS